MLDKTKFKDNQIKVTDSAINLELSENEKYKYIWEKMLKVEQIKKDNAQRLSNLRVSVKHVN